jgi:hypothetical protein
MKPKIIVIDGKTYNSGEEMPPGVRQKYEAAIRSLGDANGNRIPDAFEGMNVLADKDKNGIPDIVENLAAGQVAVSSMKIIVDGKEFNGIENLPPEVRARYEEAMGKLDANRNGIPDFVEGMINTVNQNQAMPMPTASGLGVEPPRRSTPLPTSPTITPDTSNGLMLALAGLFIFLLCVIATGAVWYFFVR